MLCKMVKDIPKRKHYFKKIKKRFFCYGTFFQPSYQTYSPHRVVTEHISIRHMTEGDLGMVLDWAKKEKWNPGKHEVRALYSADPTGYYLLELDGEPIASVAAVKFSACLVFLGLFIVLPEYRGRGYGQRLTRYVLDTLDGYPTLGTNAVLDQSENYKKSGFEPYALNTRWQGSPIHNEYSLSSDVRISLITSEKTFVSDRSLQLVIDYDAKIFSTPREAFLSHWLNMPESYVLVAIKDGIIKGYGVVSRAEEGYKLAPLFAENDEIARALYVALSQGVKGKTIQLDTHANNPASEVLAQWAGLEKGFNTLRMYRGNPPPLDNEKIYGLTSLEIG